MKNKMKKIFALLFLIHAVIIPQAKIDFQKLDGQILNAIDDLNSTGLAVGVIKNGEIVFAKGYGYKNFKTKDTVTTKTVFGIASCSKNFTAACIAALVEDGKINWDDRVIDHLPDFKLSDPYVTRELRIIDLLTHRTGFNNFDGDFLWDGTNYSRREIIKRFGLIPLKKSFRLEFGYSNIMLIVAGEVIEKVTGKTWDVFLKERIFDTLNMNSSSTSNSVFTKNTDYAYPHINRDVINFSNYDNAGPAASVNSSLEDMLKWVRMWLNNGKADDKVVLKEKTIEELVASQTTLNGGKGNEIGGTHFSNAAVTWFISDYAGRKIIQNSGALTGFKSSVTIIPEDSLGIVVLANDDSPLYNAVNYEIMNMYLTEKSTNEFAKAAERQKKRKEADEKDETELKSQQIKNTLPSLPLAGYAGVYEDKIYGKAEITFSGGELNIVLIPAKESYNSKMNHWHYNIFSVEFTKAFLPQSLITFEINKDGKVNGFKILQPGAEFLFEDYHFEKIE